MAEFTAQQIIETPFTEYEREKEYFAEIAPIIEQLLEVCKRNQIPVMLACCVSQKANGNAVLMQSGSMPSPEIVPGEMIAAKSLLDGQHVEAITMIEITEQRVSAARVALAATKH
ncbi:hypothetical protein [Pseudomonas phage Persinger]|uniref:Uncharacterized protein n=1 Tax=Pseudomonas phage Persinger TaxID=2749430 RepID=A0A7D7ENI3_9CAUD|nr:hypothetical protein KB682_gp11 [Pseudomonas phage Persinger]QMP19219.1 hypothetical protein [Pseudomonas phage Persinger]